MACRDRRWKHRSHSHTATQNFIGRIFGTETDMRKFFTTVNLYNYFVLAAFWNAVTGKHPSAAYVVGEIFLVFVVIFAFSVLVLLTGKARH